MDAGHGRILPCSTPAGLAVGLVRGVEGMHAVDITRLSIIL